MNVYPTSIGLAILSITAGAVAVVIAATGMGNSSLLFVSISVGVTSGLGAAAFECTTRVLHKIEDHAQRVEAATAQHAELLSKHVLALDRFFEMGLNSDRAARADAVGFRSWNSHGTGPFRVYNGDPG